jgi:antitoxin component of MazEF toxin-antitoxin module
MTLNAGSYKLTLPKALVKNLKWTTEEQFKVEQIGNKLVITKEVK